MIEALTRWRDEEGETHAIAVARIVLGLLLLQSALRAAEELRAGYFGDVFHWPILPEALVPSAVVYGLVVGAQGVLALLVVLGLRARPALVASAGLGTYVLLCDRVQFHHNRWAMACYALLLGFAPCDRVYGLDARRRRSSASTRGPLWAARLAQLQVSIIYLGSGGSKLLDPDWRAGRVLATRMALYGTNAVHAGIPAGFMAWLAEPAVSGALAKLAIGTELGLSVALWPRGTRAFALWWAVWFHLTIEATSRVEGFTWLTLAMLGLFATPDAGARRIVLGPGASRALRRFVTVIARLDVLARFRVEPASDGVTARASSASLVVVDRAGREHTRLGAVAMIARAVPVFFPLWVPLATLARAARGRR
ncbi:MAG TPA: HTTM domain-containing protein [Polyangiaceae bacterium]|jgi:hypothetical protein|nr:HTTM domain-containing protein [Polyangiaceae bacterium]